MTNFDFLKQEPKFNSFSDVAIAAEKNGSHNTTKLWRYAKFKNEELARKIAFR